MTVKTKSIAISLTNVNVSIRKKQILKNVSLSIPSGKMVGLLGPNGAGKSTLFRIVSGLVEPTSGSVDILGKSNSLDLIKSLAILPDRGKLPQWLTAGEWLSFAQEIYPDWNQDLAQKLIIDMDIHIDSKMTVLSRGEEARLQLLTCLARTAPIVLLDEPFTGVDMISREQIISNIISMSESNKTFLIATHDIREVENLFDMVIFLGHGQILSVDDVDQLRQNGKSVESRYREVFGK